MNKDYQNPIFRELRDQQVRYAPRERKIEQADRSEELHNEIQDGLEYSYSNICYFITEFKTEIYEEIQMPADSIRHDLQLLIEDFTESARLSPAEVTEKIWTTKELCERFHVVGKTISRWRRTGLIGRKFLSPSGGKRYVGFLDHSVNTFLKKHAEQIKRSSRFSLLSQEEKKNLVEQARILAANGLSQTETAKQLAAMTGRSAETVRYTLQSYDQENSDLSIFPERTPPIPEETRKQIFRSFLDGESLKGIAERYARTPGSIHRIIAKERAEQIMDIPLDYMDSEEFPLVRSRKQEEELLTPPQEFSQSPVSPAERKQAVPHGLPPYLAGLYEIPLLSPEKERFLFRKMNYMKYKASQLRDTLNKEYPNMAVMQQIKSLYEQSVAVKNEILLANLRLVVSIAKKHLTSGMNLFELISDGNISLIRAVEKFDYSLGNRFSTYASWTVMRNYARTIPDEQRYHDRFHSLPYDILDTAIDDRANVFFEEKNHMERKKQVSHFLNQLDEREHNIIMRRYGLGGEQDSQTLRQVGTALGITKERIRQIEIHALSKLRKAADEEHLEIPELNR
ncbi:MAG: sigma-70 family RNA polymerase sigma factor [Planctomycetaceae bacterium]|nr:sigma-70 family RNA polymerase sigma factor [Planctomycetaceae bacterium]